MRGGGGGCRDLGQGLGCAIGITSTDSSPLPSV